MIEVFKYTVEPRFNMQRDWENVLVKWRVCYIEHLYNVYLECLGNVTSLSGDEVIRCV